MRTYGSDLADFWLLDGVKTSEVLRIRPNPQRSQRITEERPVAGDLLKIRAHAQSRAMESANKVYQDVSTRERPVLEEPPPGSSVKRHLLILVALTVLVRIPLVWSATNLSPHIVDEQHYIALATSVANGHGFAWGPGTPTSIRPPLYPFFIAGLWSLSGSQSLQVVRWAQVALALASVLLLYSVGRRWFGERAAFPAAIGLAVYPSLLFSGVLLLTEVMFITLLLVTVWGFARFAEHPSYGRAFVAGAALGLAALARSVMWPFILVLAPLIWMAAGPERRAARLGMVLVLLLGYVSVVGPWSARNSARQGTFTVVDTMGGLNLLMGNYEHTPEDRMWDAVSLTGSRAWHHDLPATAPDGGSWTEGKKEKWAQRQAVAFMVAHPLVTARRAVLKFCDFWGLERDFIAGIQRGYYAPPRAVAVLAGIGITLGYALVAILGIIGIFLAPPQRNAHALLLAVILFVAGLHTVVFGHSRYHLPLIPLMLLYASAAVTSGAWRQLRTNTRATWLAWSLIAVMLMIWSRELLVRDWSRIQQLLGSGT